MEMSRKSAKSISQTSSRLKGSSSGDSLGSRDGGSSSDDQESMDNRSYTTAIVKEEGYSDDDGSQRNNSRGDSKDQSQSVRAKNREHAKNTRMRKKNYIETLKENIKNISTTRDARDRERKTAITRLADQVHERYIFQTLYHHFSPPSLQPLPSEQTLTRKKNISTFFNYRASIETSTEAWNTVLESDFTCVMPVTPYRSYPPYQVRPAL